MRVKVRGVVLKAMLSVAVLLASPGQRSAATGLAGAAPISRAVYVTVSDSQGNPVGDLTAADFAVKEGGKERELVSAAPAKTKLHLALIVEERLIADNSVRVGLFELMKRLNGAAEISLIVVGLRPVTVVDYTTSPDALVTALNGLSLNPNPNSNLTEGLSEVAKNLEQQHAERPAMIVMAFAGGQTGGPPAKDVLDRIRRSGAVMFSITLAGFEGSGSQQLESMGDASGREQLLGDGPKQAGGRRIEITSTSGAQKALQQVAGDLLGQYVLTYMLPEGVKPDRRFSATLKRKGLTLRAPTSLSDQ